MQFVKYPFLLCAQILGDPLHALTMGTLSIAENYLMLPLLFSY